jgi:hypothetical protein
MDFGDADKLLGVVGAIGALDLGRKGGWGENKVIISGKLVNRFTEGAIFNAAIFDNSLLMLDKEGPKARTGVVFA